MKLSRMFNSLPKRLAAGAIVALAIALPAATLAANTVSMTANTTVANASKNAGTMNWGPSTSLAYNEVVAIQVVYDNTEAPDSGKTTNDLHVKINIPTTAGTTQKVTTSVSGSNMTTINGSATVTLNRSDAYLQYVPGSATWKHAVSANGPQTVVTRLKDSAIVTANGSIDASLGTENPCQSGSLVIQAREMVPGVQVTKQVRNMVNGATWSTSNTAKPGETLQYEIEYQNTGNTEENKVIIRDNLPKGATLVPNTTYLVNQTNPNGILSSSNTLDQGGLYIGDYAPTANAYVIFEVKMPSADQLACGENTLTNIGVAQPQNMEEYWNSAKTTITKTCTTPGQPTYACDAFHVTVGDNRTVKVDTFTTSQSNGATFNNVVIDWGDNSTPLTTNNAVGQTYQYAQDGTYNITATAHFTVNGKDVSNSGNCSQTVSFTTPGTTPPTTPPQLVNTGAGDVFGIFAAVAVLGAFAHRLFLSRRLSRQ